MTDLKHLRVLIIEDSEQDAEIMNFQLRLYGFIPFAAQVDSAEKLHEQIAAATWDIALTDYNMPGFSAIDALNILKESSQDIPVIIVSGAIGEEVAIQAMKSGARDYVNKNHLARLGPVVERELLEAQHRKNAKRSEAELKRTQIDFQTLANSIPQLTWMTDSKGSIFWYNQRWFDYTGTTPEQMKSLGWQEFQHADHIERVAEKFRHSWETGEPWEDTFPLRGKDGQWRWFLARALPVKDAKGEIVRWFGTNTDINEQLRIQENLTKTEKALREALAARDEFLSLASHELKTPLSRLRLQIQTFKRNAKKETPDAFSFTRIQRLVEQADHQVSLLVQLMDDMLDVSSIQSGKLSIQPQNLGLCELVKEVIDRLRPEMIKARTPPTLECLSPNLQGSWDRTRIEQVVTNLLNNSMRYGHGHPVLIRLEKRGDWAKLSIKDEGIGIPQESQDRIFNRFERAISGNEVAGMGLGLFISQHIVNAHKGRIWVESEPSRGATFFVELPLSSHVSESTDLEEAV
jgi:PAS domain S-box-containing protein